MARAPVHTGLAYLGCAAVFAAAVLAQPVHKFESAEIRSSPPNTMPQMRSSFAHGAGGGRYELRNATLVDLVRTAWHVDAEGVVGGPLWADSDRFDITAVAPADATEETLRAMLQTLLKERFQLAVHSGNRDQPAFVISSGKRPQLEKADRSEASGCRIDPKSSTPLTVGSPPHPPVILVCRNITMTAFAATLPLVTEASGYLFNYPLLDRTGLNGSWNFNLRWSPQSVYIFVRPAGEPITLFQAFDHLGLKLERVKQPTPVLAIDRASRPRTADAPQVLPQFEVADIRPVGPDDPAGPYCNNVRIDPGGRVRVYDTLRSLIWEAWGAPFNFDRFVGGPAKGMDSPCWMVLAKAPVEEHALGLTTPAGWNGPLWNGVDLDTMRMMLRSFLIDRFKLEAHLEDRMIDGYALIAAKPKLKAANPANHPGCKEGPGDDGRDPRLTNPIASRLITCRNMTLAQFAQELNQHFPGSQPYVDSTGLTGRYDMTINFSPAGVVAAAQASGPDAIGEPNGAITLNEALKGQLGLKAQSRKVMAPVLVVDHVEGTPGGN